MRRTDQLAQLYGEEAAERISNARLLVVGAGGIGCELLKNLCMSGFQHIEVVDLDTIDLSNLNRQFLFQRKHIKRPKAEVAVQAICEFNPGIDAHAQQANIKDTRFDVDWFSQFDLVLNALDNLDARRHVNIKCLAAGVPLIESGTAGYLGHSTVIKGGETECFDCQEKPLEQKTFPVCTIRSTPTAPIHCIVWAKDYLFAQLFGEQTNKEGAEMEVDDEEDNMEELERLKEEAKALEILSKAVGKPDFAWQIFNKVFVQDIDRLLSMEDMWRNRVPPVRLSFEQLEAAAGKDFDATTFDDQKTLGAPEALALFCHSANWLARRATQDSERSPLAFDKDDQDALEFVAAAANLRAHAFGIEPKSIFAVKAMAGNIIPAIATTNAIVAGMMALQAINVVDHRLQDCFTVYLTYSSAHDRYYLKESLPKPNPRCSVCRRRYLTLRVTDLATTTLGDLIAFVAGQEGSEQDLGLGDEISVVEGSRILYDPDFEDNTEKTLAELGLEFGQMLTLASEDDESVVPVVLSIAKPTDNMQLISIEGFENLPEFPLLDSAVPEESDDEDTVVVATDDLQVEDGVVVVDEEDVVAEPVLSAKRKRDDGEDVNPAKRPTINNGRAQDDEAQVIELD